jgi:hypothetical protein
MTLSLLCGSGWFLDGTCLILVLGSLEIMSTIADIISNSDFRQAVGKGLYFCKSVILDINDLLSSSKFIHEYDLYVFSCSCIYCSA